MPSRARLLFVYVPCVMTPPLPWVLLGYHRATCPRPGVPALGNQWIANLCGRFAHHSVCRVPAFWCLPTKQTSTAAWRGTRSSRFVLVCSSHPRQLCRKWVALEWVLRAWVLGIHGKVSMALTLDCFSPNPRRHCNLTRSGPIGGTCWSAAQ